MMTWPLIATLCVGAMAPPAARTASGRDVWDATIGQAFSAVAHAADSPDLRETIGRHWPGYGAVAAATRMAQAAGPSREKLIGHWRSTQIVFGSPRDDHMVLRSNGLVERWSVTASGRSGAVKGRWSTQANSLSLEWDDGSQWSRPFTFHEGNLVFPNVQNQRKFWERIE
jgi:hypothetical protein